MRMSGDSFVQWMQMSAELGRVAGRRHRGDSTVRFELGDTHATEYLRNAYEDYCKANSERPLGSKGFSQNMIKTCRHVPKSAERTGTSCPTKTPYAGRSTSCFASSNNSPQDYQIPEIISRDRVKAGGLAATLPSCKGAALEKASARVTA